MARPSNDPEGNAAKPIVSSETMEAWRSYQRLRVRLAATVQRRLSECAGLSAADYDVLSLLSSAQDFSMRAIALRCGLDWEKSRLSHQLRRMESRGLVARDSCEEDVRSSVIRLTGAGRAAIARARPVYEDTVATYFGEVLSTEQTRTLSDIAASIIDKIEKDDPSRHRV